MAQLEDVIQRMELDSAQYMAALGRIEAGLRQTDRTSTRTTRSMRSGFSATTLVANQLRGALVGLSAALSVRQLVSYADTFTRVQNNLKTAGLSTGQLVVVTNQLFDVANRTRAPIDEMAQLFQRASLQTQALGINTQTLIGFMETVGQSIAVSGTSIEASRGALIQLGQALGSTAVRAEEFNSIQEGAPALLRAAALGIDEAGGSVAKLRTLVINGQISNVEFFNGIQRGSGFIRDAFARTTPTVAQAFTVLNNSITEFVGETDAGIGASRALAEGILGIAEAINSPEFEAFVSETVPKLIQAFKDIKAVIDALASGPAGGAAGGIGDAMTRDAEAAIGFIKKMLDELKAGDLAGRLIEGDPSAELERYNQLLAAAEQERIQIMRSGTGAAVKALIADKDILINAYKLKIRELMGLATEEAQAISGNLQLLKLGFTPEDQAGELARAKLFTQRSGELQPTGLATGEGGGAGGEDKFAEEIADLEREAELLRNMKLTNDQINAILKLEGAAKRQLTDAEQVRLGIALETVDALQEQRDAAEDLKDAHKELNTDLQGQLEDVQLQVKFAGQQSEEYRIQAALLEAEREIKGDLTQEEKDLVAQIQKANTELRTRQAIVDQRQARRGAQLGVQFGGANALSEQLLGISSQEFRVQQQMDAARQANPGMGEAQSAALESQIRATEEWNTKLAITENVIPNIADELATLGQSAAFGNLDQAAQELVQSLTMLIIKMAIMQAMLAAFSMAMGPSPGAGATAPPGVGPGGMGFVGPTQGLGMSGFGGPRQHGGPVSAGQGYLVGEAGPELFVPRSSGMIHPGGGANITVIDQRGPQAPPVDMQTDPRGAVSMIIRGEVDGMMKSGRLQRGMGIPRRGIARG